MERRLSGPEAARARKSLTGLRVSDEGLPRVRPMHLDPTRRPSGGHLMNGHLKQASANMNRISVERVTKGPVRLNRARSVPPQTLPRRTSIPPPRRTRSGPITSGSRVEIVGMPLEVGRRIGTGGYSQVYQATSQSTKLDCALKVVNLKAGSEEEKKNLIGEVELLKSLKGVDHVVQLIACEVSPTEALIVLELGQCDLRNILARRNKRARSLDLDFVRYWGGEVLKCIAAVHAHNIVHADLKPANFLVVETGLKIIDFGIANAVPDHTTSVHRQTQVGTVMYMAPETLERPDGCDDFKVTKASDLWSAGIMLYEMVYQRSPFSFDTNGILLLQILKQPIHHPKHAPGNVTVPIALHEIINSCLDRNPKKRPSAEQALDSLFFSPVFIDWQGLNSLMTTSSRFGWEQSGRTSTAEFEQKVRDAVNEAWKRLVAINRGT